jgi:NhaP-type Na+/H+ or K+/H+ antiporter
MSATRHGAGAGVVLGLVAVLLAQEFGFLDMTSLLPAIEDLVVGAVVGGLLGAVIGWALGKRYLRKHPES